MPELPEVEVIVRELREVCCGQRISHVDVHRADVIRYPSGQVFAEKLTGTHWSGISRHGKFILFLGKETMVVHLGMTGHLRFLPSSATLAPHTHVVIHFDTHQLAFDDARRFGRIALGSQDMLVKSHALPHLGMDALDPALTEEQFDSLLRTRNRSVKASLLDQGIIAGLGNIYIDELSFRAGIRPWRTMSSLRRYERARLRSAMRDVLAEAIANRGSSIDDYRDVWNAKGKQQERLLVYGRSGQQCVVCQSTLRKRVVAGRGTTYCNVCQK
ncbi:MAG: bifunctional DNA-formamidopyrimidine glycosylase/DNA-(apurinic or apyrimidinic site) lyase [Candidatus Dormibacteria bacterium]